MQIRGGSIRRYRTTIDRMVGRHRRSKVFGGSARVCLLVGLALALPAAPASAHPLGNFSINHQTRVKISSDRVELLYILDQAEIPTAQERGVSRRELIERKQAEVRKNLFLIVDGKRRLLRMRGAPRLSFPRGAGGLPITRLELPLAAPVRRPRLVDVRDFTFEGRIGWVDLVAEPGSGTAVRTPVSRADPTKGLRTYRGVSLKGVPDQRAGRFLVRPGNGTLAAPKLPTPVTGGAEGRRERPDSGEDGFTKVFEDAANGEGLFVFLLLAAFAWGALHAISPGHGKAMVAGYLAGTRGTPRHALALGLTITATHTAAVFALGLVVLTASELILPEQLYPWLGVASGLMVVAIGLAVMRSRLRRWRAVRATGDHQAAGEGHHHTHHHHHHREPVTGRGLIGLGISGGLVPCPSALVVLIAAISQHRVGLGMVLIVAFSLGLAATVSAVGLAVIWGGRLVERLRPERRLFGGRLSGALPALSSLLIVAAGALIAARALPELG
jgi:nickel/cobalt transporter (NicO) family protein